MFRRLYFVNASPDWETLLVVLSNNKRRPEKAGVRTERWGFGHGSPVTGRSVGIPVIARTSGSEHGRTSV